METSDRGEWLGNGGILRLISDKFKWIAPEVAIPINDHDSVPLLLPKV